ncbi:iron-containing redox enzyme family protein [Nocardia sp. 348MFTsu5.1]|uniref:iron-containing redox enzyme family protein n=1 Tax=Nocardia sp. 348MFTsu5.1 TaxID=1172185 RepID=UPI000371D621|nr:iron-containing redox enzyme family protein [Nocardia sp. 348MFTsu5.1]
MTSPSKVSTARSTTRALPRPCGPLSSALIAALSAPASSSSPISVETVDCDPYGVDLQLALYICYELHYRGFTDVDDDWEWNPDLLRFRAELEHRFSTALTADVNPAGGATEAVNALLTEPAHGSGPSWFLKDTGTWDQMREYFIHRSIYHLKEADPHAFAIPRLTGQAKASFVAIEFDEYGGGHGEHVHQKLFGDLLEAAGLDADYLAYLEQVPGESLALVNLMSMFGLHRSRRAATIGHFAATEITSPPGSARLVQALERLEAPDACVHFYREHVEADAMHEQVVRHDVISDLLDREPELEADLVFGVAAFLYLEDKFADHLMSCWSEGRTSLITPER